MTIRAAATEGTEIWLMRGPSGGHQVRVKSPDGSARQYGGDLARDRFEAFSAAYDRLFGGVDTPHPLEDTDPTR